MSPGRVTGGRWDQDKSLPPDSGRNSLFPNKNWWTQTLLSRELALLPELPILDAKHRAFNFLILRMQVMHRSYFGRQ